MISDGTACCKVLAGPGLFPLIQRNQITESTILRIKAMDRHIDETLLDAAPFVIVSEVDVISQVAPFVGLSDTTNMTLLGSTSSTNTPLAGRRACYLEPHANYPLKNDPTWAPNRDEIKLSPSDAHAAQHSPQRISALISSHKVLPHFGTVVARITKKSALRSIGNPGEKQPYPFQAYFELDDGSGRVTAVMWYKACRTYYNIIHVGDVIALENYRVRAATNFSLEFSDAPLELSLNSQNPEAVVHLIRTPDVSAALNMPTRDSCYTLVNRAALAGLEDGCTLDYVGVVVFVGRIQREPPGTGKEYAPFRWVELRDASSPNITPLKLYSCGLMTEFEQVRLGMILMCSKTVLHSIVPSSSPKRHIFLSTTINSQYVSWLHDPEVDLHTNPFGGMDAVIAVEQWSRSPEFAQYLTKPYREGYSTLPFTKFVSLQLADLDADLQTPIPLGSVAEIGSTLFTYCRKTVTVQATVSQMVYTQGFSSKPATLHQLSFAYPLLLRFV